MNNYVGMSERLLTISNYFYEFNIILQMLIYCKQLCLLPTQVEILIVNTYIADLVIVFFVSKTYLPLILNPDSNGKFN